MNALLVLFFLSIIVNDYFFKEGYFMKIYLSLFCVYYVIYLFTNKSLSHTSYKNALLAIFSQSYDPTVYAKLQFDTGKAKKFLDEYYQKTGHKITWTLFVIKVLATAIRKYPLFNTSIRCGRLIDRKNVDLSCLVDVDGKVSREFNFKFSLLEFS